MKKTKKKKRKVFLGGIYESWEWLHVGGPSTGRNG